MDFNKLIRYKVLDTCFRDTTRFYTIPDLIAAVNDAYQVHKIDRKIERRQIYDDIKFMKSTEGWSIQLNENLRIGRKKAQRYADIGFSIFNSAFHPLFIQYLNLSVFVLSCYRHKAEYNWVDELILKLEQEVINIKTSKKPVQFEENEYLHGAGYIQSLVETITDQTVIELVYQPFGRAERKLKIHPYLLKAYNQRWFLVGLNPEYPRNLSNIALDRIKDFKLLSSEDFIECGFNLNEYFDDVIGISVPSNQQVETIKLLFINGRGNYVITKPMHDTQKKKVNDDGSVEITLKLIPNRELVQQILQFGKDVKVLSPVSLVKEIKELIAQMKSLYG